MNLLPRLSVLGGTRATIAPSPSRAPGRHFPALAQHASIPLTRATGPSLRRASAAHGEHEKRNGGQYDANWPDWYTEYIVREQAGKELPQ